MKSIVALLLLVVVATAAAKHVLRANSPTAITGTYIVVLKQGSGSDLRDAHIEKLQAMMAATNDSSEIVHKYNIGGRFVGYSAKLSDSMVQIELAHQDVDYIEAAQTVSAVYHEQTGATWGLARLSHKTSWNQQTSYKYDTTAGAGVNVYVLDTGIHITHHDFEGRASSGYTNFPGEKNTDLNGHGTHCAGTIGGKTYGVAKKVSLIGVKVLNAQGSGSYPGVIAGIDWVTAQYEGDTDIPSVASMSLGGGFSQAVNDAVAASVAAGVAYSIAAGNSNANACTFSPASASTTSAAITVGATTNTDARASYSNWGPCVNIYAPGSAITSDWWTTNTATNTISGTSMACPHVSGVLALKLGKDGVQTPQALKDWITSTPIATWGKVTGIPTTVASNNTFLFSPYENL